MDGVFKENRWLSVLRVWLFPFTEEIKVTIDFLVLGRSRGRGLV